MQYLSPLIQCKQPFLLLWFITIVVARFPDFLKRSNIIDKKLCFLTAASYLTCLFLNQLFSLC